MHVGFLVDVPICVYGDATIVKVNEAGESASAEVLLYRAALAETTSRLRHQVKYGICIEIQMGC